jgi:glycosyltransferase involved in cell wall biosynthesis
MSQLVSVIIPCYNAEAWVAEAIQSALAQDYHPLEVIVIDDGSTDRSLEIVRRFEDRIRWESGPNRGGNWARNRGLALSKGEYTQWLDADDVILPGKISRQAAFLASTDADMVVGDWRFLYQPLNGKAYCSRWFGAPPGADFLDALLGLRWFAINNAYLCRRSAIDKIGGWDERLRTMQDWDFWIRLLLSGAKFAYQPGAAALWRRDAASMHKGKTVSTLGTARVDAGCALLDNAASQLERRGILDKYRSSIARSCFLQARAYHALNPGRCRERLAVSRRLHRSLVTEIYCVLAAILGSALVERALCCGQNTTARCSRILRSIFCRYGGIGG